MLFKTLTIEEEKQFRDYARDNEPPDMASWEIYHPVCREVWTARGIGPTWDPIGRLIPIGNGGFVLGCDYCSPENVGCRIYRVNIYPYKGTCYQCGKVLVAGQSDSWPELFNSRKAAA